MQKNIDMKNRVKLPPTKSSLALQQRSALSGQRLYEIVADGEDHTARAALRRRSSALSVLLGKSDVHRNSLIKNSEPEDLPKSETVSKKSIDREDLKPPKSDPDNNSGNPKMKRRTGFFSLDRRSSFMDLGRQQVKTANDDRAYTIQEKIQLLKQVSTFKLMSRDKLEILASKLKTEYYKIGEKIIKQHTADG